MCQLLKTQKHLCLVLEVHPHRKLATQWQDRNVYGLLSITTYTLDHHLWLVHMDRVVRRESFSETMFRVFFLIVSLLNAQSHDLVRSNKFPGTLCCDQPSSCCIIFEMCVCLIVLRLWAVNMKLACLLFRGVSCHHCSSPSVLRGAVLLCPKLQTHVEDRDGPRDTPSHLHHRTQSSNNIMLQQPSGGVNAEWSKSKAKGW